MGPMRARDLARCGFAVVGVAVVVVAATVLSAASPAFVGVAAAADSAAPAPRIDPAALRGRLRSLADTGDAAGVLRAADEALGIDRELAVAWEYRAFALHRLGRTDEARDAYRALVQRSPDHAWGWTQLGALELELGRSDDARAALEKAVALAPSSEDAWRKLVRVHRSRADFVAAMRTVEAAAAAKADRRWCALEGASIAWAAGDPDDAARRLDAAETCGADAAAVRNVRRLVAFDAALTPEERVRRRGGAPWQVAVGPFVVETRVGPRLPPEVETTLANATAAYPEILGVARTDGVAMKLLLSRTVEEHDALRRLWFPAAPLGTAFTVDIDTSADRRVPQRRAVTMHVAWPQSGLERSIAHEAAHAFLRVRTAAVPPWLDEAVATYLEGVGLGEAPGVPHDDLVKSLVDARAAGRLVAWEGLPVLAASAFQGDGARIRYAQSWLLLHWMLHADGAPGRAGLLRLLDTSRGWTAGNDALARTLGRPWKDVAAALDAHLDRLAK